MPPEFVPQSQLYSPQHPAFAEIADKDHDGMPDSWELMYGLNPYDASDASADPDKDGLTNLQEYQAGTNPRSATSKLAITQESAIRNGANNDFRITFPSVSGTTYRVEYSDTLAPGSWTALGADLAGTGGNLQATDTATSGHAQRFYRVGVVVP